MTARTADETRRILLRAFPGCRIESITQLEGGVSARAVVAELVLQDGTSERLVVRRPTYPTLAEARSKVENEHALLSRCVALGIPAPKPRSLDVEAAAVVLEHIEGAPEFAPSNLDDMLRQMAAQLALIHRVNATSEFDFLPRRKDSAARSVLRAPKRLDATLDESGLRAALSKLWPWQQRNPDVLLHGDFWPGNLLWKGATLVAVLDWEEAEVGDPLADIAVSRLDLLWAFGEAAMHTFTQCYREQTQIDWNNLARWDLCAALRPMSNLARWAPAYAGPPISRPDVTEHTLREGHQAFVEQALRSLSIDPAPLK